MADTEIKAGVIGHPIAHSKSPIIHTHWMTQHDIFGRYDAIDVAPEELTQSLERLIEQGYVGLNVTLPHKEAVYALCDDLDDAAKAIGAVNMLTIRNGRIHGYNTDAFGFIENLKAHPVPLHKDRPAVVLGAGGAARAVVYALKKEGFENIILINRTIEKAEALAEFFGLKNGVVPWDDRMSALVGAGLLVNTTALGMRGKDALDLSLDALLVDAPVYDIVYVPLMTELLKQAQARGNPVVTGIGMLLHQARPAFAAWFSTPLPNVDAALEQKVLGV